MKTVIIYTHPRDKSYCHAILEAAVSGCEKYGHELDVIDLYKDGFDPVMNENDLYGFVTHKIMDPQAEDYGERIKDADRIIFIFPIWWGVMPAMTKGFIDKVIAPGSFYEYNEGGTEMHTTVNPDLRVSIITTMSSEKEKYRDFFHNAIEGALVNGTFLTTGVKTVDWKSFNEVKFVSQEQREKWLEEVVEYMK